jgi:hypothetical protein
MTLDEVIPLKKGKKSIIKRANHRIGIQFGLLVSFCSGGLNLAFMIFLFCFFVIDGLRLSARGMSLTLL